MKMALGYFDQKKCWDKTMHFMSYNDIFYYSKKTYQWTKKFWFYTNSTKTICNTKNGSIYFFLLMIFYLTSKLTKVIKKIE